MSSSSISTIWTSSWSTRRVDAKGDRLFILILTMYKVTSWLWWVQVKENPLSVVFFPFFRLFRFFVKIMDLARDIVVRSSRFHSGGSRCLMPRGIDREWQRWWYKFRPLNCWHTFLLLSASSSKVLLSLPAEALTKDGLMPCAGCLSGSACLVAGRATSDDEPCGYSINHHLIFFLR